MAGNIDTRIIQMQFDNREFEKNIAKSTKSVEELKEAMDFEETSKGLEDFAHSSNSLGFDKLADNIQRLTDKFTGLGNIGEYVLSRIRYRAQEVAQSVENLIRSISVDQISVGQGKYDSMNKAVMTIISGGKATEEEAYNVMERVMVYTDQTSHNFQTMVGQISSLSSIGLNLVEAERLIESMGNAATFAGQDAMAAAGSMEVLSKALSSNFLGYEQFRSLNTTYHVITDTWREQALEAAVAVGTLRKENDKYYVNVKGQKGIEVTAQNLQDTLKARWLTGEVLRKIYENYAFGDTVDDLKKPAEAAESFGKTAYLTGQRALTLADALNAIKESVSGGWMTTFRLLFGDVTEAAEHFTNICDRVVESLEKIKDFRNDVLEEWAITGGRKNLFALLLGSYEDGVAEGTVGILDVIDQFGGIVEHGLYDFLMLFADPVERSNFEDQPGHFKAWIAKKIELFVQGALDFMKGIKDFFDEDITIGDATMTRLEVIHDIVDGVSGALKLALDVLDGVKTFIQEIAAQLSPSADSIIWFLGKLGEEIYLTAQDTGDAGTIKKFFTDLAATLKPVTDGINSVVEAITNFLIVLLGLDDETKDRTAVFNKLGSVLLTIGDIIAKIAGPILEFIATLLNAVTELIRGGVTPEKFAEFGKTLSEGFTTMMRSFVDSLPESFGFLGNWIRDLFGLWEDEADADNKSFFTFLHKLFTGQIGNIGEMIGQLTQGFSLKDALENGFGFLSAWNFLGQIIGFFKGTNLYGVIMAFLGVATLAGLISLINKAKRAVKEITAFFGDVGGNLKQGFLGDYEWFGERVLNMAKAIGIIVACVVALGSMNTGAMIQGLIGVGLVLGAIVGLYWILSKDNFKANHITQVSTAAVLFGIAAVIATITVGLSILSLAILPLASDWRKMMSAVVGITVILAAMGGFIFLLVKGLQSIMDIKFYESNKNKWNKIGQLAVMILVISVAIIAISTAVSTLAIALTPLAAIGWEGMLRAIIAFAAFLAIFGVFIVVMLDKLDDLAFRIGGGSGWSGYGKMALAMLALSASVTLLSVGIGALAMALTPLSLMSWEGFIRAVVGLGLILLELGMMITFVTNLTSKDKGATLKVAGMAAFCASLGILILALTPLALMTDKAMIRAIIGLGAILLELALMIEFVTKLGVGDQSATLKVAGMAGFCASLAILIFALQPLATMSMDELLQALIGLGAVMAEILLFMVTAKSANVDTGALTSFIAFALSIAILIFALKPLSEMTPEGYLKALVGLAAVMLEIIILLKIMEQVRPSLKTAGSTLLLLIGLGASMILFSIAFNEVRDVPWQNIIAFAAGIALMIAAIALTAKFADKLSFKGIIMISAALAAILGVLAVMIPILMGAIGSSLSGFASRLAMFAELMSIFSGKMEGVDEQSIGKFESILSLLQEAVSIMVSLVINNGIIQSYMRTVSSMTIVADQLVTFNGKMDRVDPGSVDKAQLILGKIKSMLENEVAEISSYSGISTLFSTAMYNLGTGIEIFDNHTGNVGDVKDNSAIALIQALSGCANDLDIIYKMDIDTLTSKLTGLGGALMLYALGAKESQGVVGFDPTNEESISAITSAVALLQAITRAFAEEDGFTIPENMPNTEEIGLFGAQLAALAAALVEFEKAGSSLGEGTDKALEVINFFEQLKLRLADTGFIENVQTVTTSFRDADNQMIQPSEIEVFGKNIEQLGLSLGQFALSTSQVDSVTGEMKPIDFTLAVSALDSIVEVGNKLPSVGGVIEVFIGERESLATLSTEIGLLGSAMGGLYEATSQYDADVGGLVPYDFKNTIDFLNAIVDAQNKLPYMGGINLRVLITGDQMSFDDLGQDLAELGAGLNVMCAAINGEGEEGGGFDPDKAGQAADLVRDHIIPVMNMLATDLPKVGGFWNIIKTSFSGRDTNMSDVSDVMAQLGTGLSELGKGLDSGGWDHISGVETAFDALAHIFEMMVSLEEYVQVADAMDDITGFTGFGVFQAITDLVTFLTEGVDYYGVSTGPALDSLISIIEQIDSAMLKYSGAVDNIEAIQSRINIFKTLMESLSYLTTVDTSFDWGIIGVKLTTELASSITIGCDNVLNAAKNMMKTVYDGAKTTDEVDWQSLGTYVATGVAYGIQYGGPEYVTPAVVEMMTEAYNAGKLAIDSNSPSKLFMQLGMFAGEGMAIGIRKESSEVGENAGALGNVALEKAKTMVALISSVMANELDTNPTITPVLDLSQIEAGMQDMDSRFAGRSLGIDTSVAAANLGGLSTSMSPYDVAQLKPDYSGLYARMDQLGNQINSLGSAISKIKIVLNTGVVAGGVTNDVDKNLGRKTFYAGRNN